jgi:O-antigen ligase
VNSPHRGRFDAVQRSLTLEHATAVWVAVTVLVFAGGSSSVHAYASVAKPARWPVLLVLDVLGLLLARDRLRPLRLAPAELAGAVLVLLGLLSASWSILPRLTIERSISIGQIAVAAGALAVAARGRPLLVRRILIGLASGAICIAVLGFIVLAIKPSIAAQSATQYVPWRYKGFGENPNTVSMFCAIVAPLVAWLVLSSTRRAERIVFGIALASIVSTIALSGSRGALVAGLLGSLVLTAQASSWRARLAVAGCTVAVFAGAVFVSQLPAPLTPTAALPAAALPGSSTSGSPAGSPGAPHPLARGLPSVTGSRLADELQPPSQVVKRSLFGSSGRVQAWRWALGDARKRPVAGYGFGTESNVFFDRLYSFEGGLPENSFVGVTLQLGALGLLALVALVIAVAVSAVGSIRRLVPGGAERGLAAACAGAALAGLAVSVGQSYLYSAGNIATLTVWICAFFAADAARTWSGTA